jgi:cyclophilin family peptidyl-prolyl cis-trans isomerase
LNSTQFRKLCYPCLLLLLILALAACGGASQGGATVAPTTVAAATTAPDAADTPATATEPAAEAAVEPTAESAPAPDTEKVPPPEEMAEGAASAVDVAARNDMYSAPPEMTIDPSKFYYATLKTDRGDIKVQLFADRAPITVNNFVFLAREGFYNNTTFHRVIDGFMAQAGDPTGTGAGGPGYSFQDEFDASLTFDRPGLLAMANSGPGTNGSQFFITFAPADWLNNLHTIFGEVIEGADVLNLITRRDPGAGGAPGDTLYTVLIEESDTSMLPTPLPPTPTPTPYAPTSAEGAERPLAEVPAAERVGYYNTAPELVIDTAKTYTATIATSKGDLVVALYDDMAPTAVNNFVVLANLGYYDGLPINQNSPDNALIFGSPDNDARNDVGYRVRAELNLTNTLDIGSLTYMPFQEPTGELIASGSQLLIARIVPPAEANTQFSFFGKVVSGIEVLDQLTPEDTIESITITESE